MLVNSLIIFFFWAAEETEGEHSLSVSSLLITHKVSLSGSGWRPEPGAQSRFPSHLCHPHLMPIRMGINAKLESGVELGLKPRHLKIVCGHSNPCGRRMYVHHFPSLRNAGQVCSLTSKPCNMHMGIYWNIFQAGWKWWVLRFQRKEILELQIPD